MLPATGRARALLLLLGALLLGVGIGVAGARWWQHGQRAARGERRGNEAYLERLARDLALAPAQRDSVRTILERYAPRMDSVWADVRPRFETLRAEMRSEIERQLTTEQRRAYGELRLRMRGERNGGR